MAKSQIITIRLNAGTADFVTKMNEAGAKVQDFGQRGGQALQKFSAHTTSSVAAASGAIREFEGTLPIRAVERFLATTLGLGPALAAAFPIIGAVAFGELIIETVSMVREFFNEIQEAPARIAGAFRELNAPLKTTNDELQVTNDRLQNDIDKLEGHRQNTLKLALDEARVAADKLADSLDKDLKGLNTLLDKQNLGGLKAFFTSQASTTDIKKEIGGETGFGGFTGAINKITDEGTAAIANSTTAKQRDAAQTELNTKLIKAYADEAGKLSKQLDEARKLQLIREGKANLPARFSPDGIRAGTFAGGDSAKVADQQVRINELEGTIRALNEARNSITLRADNVALTGKKEALQAVNANAKLDKPYEDKLKELNAQLDGIKAKIRVIGADEATQAVAKGFEASLKAIEGVNKSLDIHHQLTDAQKGKISGKEQQIAAAEAEDKYKTKLDATTVSIIDRIKSTEILTAAIGKGYQATRDANVQAELYQKFGKDLNDPSKQADVAKTRGLLTQQYDAQHLQSVTKTTDALGGQIELEKSLAEIQAQGAEAIRLVTLAYRLRALVADGATNGQIKSEIALADAQKQNLSNATLTQLSEKLALTERLTAAQIQGAEALRKAGLEEKYAQLKKNGVHPDVIDATRNVDAAEHQQQITAEALKTGIEYRNQLEALDAQIIALRSITVTAENRRVIEQSLFNLEQERLKVMVQQELAQRTASAGIRAFFIEMKEAGKATSDIIFDALNQGVDRLSENLSKLATGQKTQWAQAFKDIGQQIIQEEIKSSIKKGVGSLHDVIFGPIPDPKKKLKTQDGQTQPTAFWVQMAIPPASNGGSNGPAVGFPTRDPLKIPGLGGIGSIGGGVFGGALGGGIYSLFGGGGSAATESVTSAIDFGGFLAGGGDVDPGHSYVVGEKGPETFRPKSAGSIIPHGASGGGTVINNYYTDARGTDPVLSEARTKQGIQASHNSAVSNGAQAMLELQRRTPQ